MCVFVVLKDQMLLCLLLQEMMVMLCLIPLWNYIVTGKGLNYAGYYSTSTHHDMKCDFRFLEAMCLQFYSMQEPFAMQFEIL